MDCIRQHMFSQIAWVFMAQCNFKHNAIIVNLDSVHRWNSSLPEKSAILQLMYSVLLFG